MHRSSDFSTQWTLDYAAMWSLSAEQEIPGTRWCVWQNAMAILCTELAATKAGKEAKLLAARLIHQRKRVLTASSRPHQRPGGVTTLQIGSYSGLDSSRYGIPSGDHIEDRPVYLVYHR